VLAYCLQSLNYLGMDFWGDRLAMPYGGHRDGRRDSTYGVTRPDNVSARPNGMDTRKGLCVMSNAGFDMAVISTK
jgi:hypothetical protein